VSKPPWPSGAAWIDVRYCPVEDARISVVDLGVTRSDCTYDVVHVWEGRFYRLDTHLDRFAASMARLRLDPGCDRAGIEDILHGCVRHAGLRAAYVSMTCTRGRMPPGSRDLRTARSMFYCYAVAEELRFGRAASRLHTAPLTLSRQIRGLECVASALLRERITHRVELPSSAIRFLEHCQRRHYRSRRYSTRRPLLRPRSHHPSRPTCTLI
jgi:Amino-transferase class IV/Bacterial regulatory helix-turn-helix protein, lysR family